jgi:uncharacterized protein YdeI (YjbR/CyaY-like superfamily)
MFPWGYNDAGATACAGEERTVETAETTDATFFETPAALRAWLEANHETARELWVGYYKKGSGHPSITWPESVDEALCFGWIDGIRKTIDEQRYRIRFTPRKAGSNWSAVNVARVAALTAEGRMRPAGLRAFEARQEGRTGVYSYEQRDSAELGEELEARFRANADAWAFFETRPRSYRAAAIWWVVSAKKEETRRRRFEQLLADSAAGRTIKELTPPAKRRSPVSGEGGEQNG